MPNVLDGIGVTLPKVARNVCPICEKAAHDTTTDKKEGKGDLTSVPANLGCTALVPVPGLPKYTTAAHHLIPVNQCLKQFPRLSQMCKAVGYNANNPANGLALPTVGQKSANVYGASGLKYGNLKDKDKMKVAFLVMEGTDLQWHVGHHDWKALKLDTDKRAHPPNYDKLVKLKLRDLEKDFKKKGATICDPKKKERGGSVISMLNAESGKIRGKVLGWSKYFVSALASAYAKEYK